MTRAAGAALLLALSACAPRRAPSPLPVEPPMNEEAVRGVTDPALRALLHDHWEAAMARWPTWASRLGDHRWDDRLEERSPAAFAADDARARALLARARALPTDGMSEADRLHLALFVDALDADVAANACHAEWWALSAGNNPLAAVNDLQDGLPVTTLEEGRALVERYRAVPRFVAEWEASLRAGMDAGYTGPADSARRVLQQLRDELARPDAELTLALPLKVEHPGWPAPDRERYRAQLGAAVAEARPALERFARFLEDELIPASRPEERAGARFLPDGEACYRALIRQHTSLPLAADAVHQAGLDELARIHAEMRRVGARALGTDDLGTLLGRLREDPALRFTSAGEVLAAAEDHLARARAAMPRLIGRLPQADCVVKPIPDYLAPYTYVAYYQPAVPGEAPGEYRVNTYRPETRLRFEAAALAFHESIPGHHLQIAVAQELPELPAFRRHLGWTAYVEGWALYAEQLADEVGLYRDDLDQLGRLSFDAWRASRLVVDTGMHHQGWTRARAEAFLLANTALAPENVRNEVDRYLTWPGQALAYKIGHLEIARLRRETEARLGERFDLRAFNDRLLGAGAVSLPVLRARVEAWDGS